MTGNCDDKFVCKTIQASDSEGYASHLQTSYKDNFF